MHAEVSELGRIILRKREDSFWLLLLLGTAALAGQASPTPGNRLLTPGLASTRVTAIEEK